MNYILIEKASRKCKRRNNLSLQMMISGSHNPSIIKRTATLFA